MGKAPIDRLLLLEQNPGGIIMERREAKASPLTTDAGTPKGALHRIRRTPIGWPALALIVPGAVWDYFQLRSGGAFYGRPKPNYVNVEAATSFGAAWVVFVLFLMAAWDLLVAVDDPDDPSLGFGPIVLPRWLRSVVGGNRWFVGGAFVLGHWLGHKFWL